MKHVIRKLTALALILAGPGFSNAQIAYKPIYISGSISPVYQKNINGSWQFLLHREIFTGTNPVLNQSFPLTLSGDQYQLTIQPHAAYVYLQSLFAPGMKGRFFLIRAGDSLHLSIDQHQKVIVTKNPLFSCQLELNLELDKITPLADTAAQNGQYHNFLVKVEETLSRYHKLLDSNTLSLLRLNYASDANSRLLVSNKQQMLSTGSDQFRKQLVQMYHTIQPPAAWLIRSSAPYMRYRYELQQRYSSIQQLSQPDSSIFKLSFGNILREPNAMLREKLLSYLFLRAFRTDSNAVNMLGRIIPEVKDSLYRNILLAMQQSRTPGNPAFPFALEDSNGKIHRLEDYKGKVILAKFWFSGCVPCMQLEKILKPMKEKYAQRKDIVFLSINVDMLKATWLRGMESGKYDAASDIRLSTFGQGNNHPMLAFYQYSGMPQLLLIDKNGDIISSSPQRPHDTGSLADFEKLIVRYL